MIYINRLGKCLTYPGNMLQKEEKMQRLYHYTSFNSFVRIWLTKTLKFGEIPNMNDMFEHNNSAQSNLLNVNHLDLFHKERRKYKQISLTMDYDSFTQGCMSPMMWGVYADKAKGVCIELDYNKLQKHIKDSMLHDSIYYVQNLPEPPLITSEAVNDFDSFFRKNQKDIFFTKHESWANENEYRIISKDDDILNIEEAISAIYITKCNSTECECIEKLLKDNNGIFFGCIYQDSMSNIGTYYNICNVEYRKQAYKHNK
ncbi:MAG: DUF2971 domain-containing protein [Prevotella sp.]|nr:DUF2971 domain-containing protein [Prevotella sp.]